MSDRATITIDCERYEVSTVCDQLSCFVIGAQMEETKAALITWLILPEIKKLMGMSKSELRKAYTAMMCQ